MKNFMKGLVIVLAFALLVACGKDTAKTNKKPNETTNNQKTEEQTDQKSDKLEGSITASGSSALLPLAQDAADKFKEVEPNISITVNGGGSGTGLKQVFDGSVDIGSSDVYAEDKLEADKAKELVDHKVCVVTMAAIVNNDIGEKVNDLTKDQLKKIFTGEIKNWNEVGGPDEKVLLVTRPDSSGTRALFTKYALDGITTQGDSYLETDNSGELLETIKSNKGAIGYVALPYILNNSDVTPVSIDGVKPSLETTYDGSYPVWGYEHMYTKGEPNEVVKAFIDYIMSDEYASHIEEQGYGATSNMKVER